MERRTFTPLKASEIQSKIGRIAGALSKTLQDNTPEAPKPLSEKIVTDESKET